LPRLRDSRDDLAALIAPAATQLGLSEELVEKDFWVTEILRALQAPPEGVSVIFKGGTSLSKGFQLIQRMSEDVDILLHGELSGAQRKRALRETTDGVSKHIGLPAILERDEKDRKLVSRFTYGERSMEIGTPGVLLELGFRGYPQPSRTVSMISYLAEYVATRQDRDEIRYQELATVTLHLLAPERTLLEKIFALHCVATNFPDTTEQVRSLARYYYDVKFLLDDERVRDGVKDLGNLETYCREELVSAGVGSPFPGPDRPAGGYAESSAFHPPEPLLEVLAPAYEVALEFVFLGTPRPTLHECIDTVIRWGAIL
jgi:hypothetical protein